MVKLGVGQRFVLGDGSHGDIQTLSAIALRYYPLLARRLFRLVSSPKAEPELPQSLTSVHTPTKTLKNAALLALIGTVLITVLLVRNLIFNLLNLLRSLVPSVTLFQSFICAFGCFSVAVFFYVFHRAQ